MRPGNAKEFNTREVSGIYRYSGNKPGQTGTRVYSTAAARMPGGSSHAGTAPALALEPEREA